MIRKICLFGMALTLCLSFGLTSLHAQSAGVINPFVDVEADNAADQAIQSFVAGAQGGDPDVTAGDFANQNFGGQQVRVGRFTTGDGSNVASVLVFELPDLGAVANPFLTSSLDFTLLGIDTTAANPAIDYSVDLYGIDSRPILDDTPGNTFQVLFEDFYAGPDVDPNATLLAEDIITPDDIQAAGVTSLFSTDITEYLNAQYDGGAGVGELVFLRLNPTFDPDVIVDNRSGYFIGSGDNADVTRQPVINFTSVATVPEPTSLSLLLLGATAFVSRRRRNR